MKADYGLEFRGAKSYLARRGILLLFKKGSTNSNPILGDFATLLLWRNLRISLSFLCLESTIKLIKRLTYQTLKQKHLPVSAWYKTIFSVIDNYNRTRNNVTGTNL